MADVGSASVDGVGAELDDQFAAFAAAELDAEDGVNREMDTETTDDPDPGQSEVEEVEAEEQPEADAADGSDARGSDDDPESEGAETSQDGDGPEEAAQSDDGLEDYIEWHHPEHGQIRVAVSEMRDGWMRTQDYTRKTTQHADAVRAHQDRVNDWESRAQQEMQLLQAFMPQQPQWNEEDPIGSAEAQHRYQTEMQQRGAILQQQEAARLQADQEFRAEHQAMLPRRIPEWNNPEVAPREKRGIQSMLLSMGYSPEDMDIADSRAVAVARKAYLYDQAKHLQKAQKTAAKKKVAAKPPAPVRSSGPAPRPKSDPGKARLVKAHRQKGNADSMAAILMEDMKQ